jgi:hypothetical protein
MTTIRPGMPGHNHGTAFTRLRPGKLADGPARQGVQDEPPKARTRLSAQGAATIQAGIGQRSQRNSAESGMYATKERAVATLMDHIGMQMR